MGEHYIEHLMGGVKVAMFGRGRGDVRVVVEGEVDGGEEVDLSPEAADAGARRMVAFYIFFLSVYN